MEKVVKKCYKILDLPYSATIEEVNFRRSALIHLIETKALKRGKVNQKKVKQINNAADKIVFNIKKYGVGDNNTIYETDSNSAFNLIFAFVVMSVFVAICVYILL